MDNNFKNAKVGDIVKFGNYIQTANGGTQPIEWRVLSKKENKMLLVSKYGLESRRFDSSSNNWSSSEIRKWLNGEFYNKAFNEKEKKSIKSSNLSDVGTTDNVFLLSFDEANKYFANSEARRCKATDYAKNNAAWVGINDYSVWWLRSLNPYNNSFLYDVDNNGDIRCNIVIYNDVVARPALWINL